MAGPDPRDLGRVFNEVPELYDRVRPAYPDELFADLVAITGMASRSAVLEVGCGTGQATRSLAALAGSVTAVEPGADMAALARERLAAAGNVEVENSTFEEWDGGGRRFDVLVAASSWHWVNPSVGWRKAHDVLHPGGWMTLLGNVIVRRPGEPEVYAETADLHERFSPGNPGWGDPPLEDEVRTTNEGWGTGRRPRQLVRPDHCGGGTRPFSGSTGTASPTSSAQRRCTGGSPPRSVSRCSTRSQRASARRWATRQPAATWPSCGPDGAPSDSSGNGSRIAVMLRPARSSWPGAGQEAMTATVVRPPSTSMTVPWTKAASSLAR